MRISETANYPKISTDLIEDFVVTTPDFIAVIDGATDKTGHRINGMFGGRFVAQIIARETEALAFDVSLDEWLALMTSAIDIALREFGWPDDLPRPCACSVTYSRHRREIWRVGDSGYRINSENFIGGKLIDDVVGETRANVLKEALSSGRTVQELLENDIGRQAIIPLLQGQHRYANSPDSEFGYPVFNGFDIPQSLLERPVSVPPGSLVVLFSDGYDFPHDTVAQTVAAQESSYDIDPLRIGLDGARPGTKGLFGQARHDDQSFVSFFTSSETA